MAQYTESIQIKIQDLETFSRLVAAIGTWADHVKQRGNLTPAETELLDAAVEQAEATDNRANET